MKIATEPKERAERIRTLEKSLSVLKQEFVGLDKIIDELGENISSWYITPEIITRPVIVSLWGMTGTGKSSVVKRLLELLGLERNSMTFDCGECSNDNKDLVEMIGDSFGLDKDESTFTKMEDGVIKLNRAVFVFDEFQYARTIDEEGSECVKPSLRPVWSILDSGILHINENYSWDFSHFCSFFDDLCVFADSHPEIKVVGNMVPNKKDVEAIKKSLGFLHYSCLGKFGMNNFDEGTEENEKFALMETGYLRIIVKKLNEVEPGLGVSVVEEILGREWSLKELTEFIAEKKKLMPVSKKLDCSGSLVIVIGNLDEAFRVSDDLDPDMNADIFCDITSKVTVADIKRAMLRRYRPEQVARLGNNLIKYPTLGKKHFENIIKKEVSRIIKEFNDKVDPVKINIGSEVYQLLYMEGVFPTQGVRPVFTTINTILTPYLSKILIEKKEGDKEVLIGIKNSEEVGAKGFKQEEIIISLTFNEGERTHEYPQRLNLGGVRDPEKRKKRYASSVHEAGHAVVYSYLTGQVPDTIVSVSTDHGGFCSTYNKESEGEIDSKLDLDISTKVGMAGYLAEHYFFDNEMCLLGSGNDIEESWNYFSTAAYRLGYYKFCSYSDRESEAVSSGISNGLDIKTASSIDRAIKEDWEGLIKETGVIIETERELIRELALYLGEHGSMSSDTFLKIIKESGSQLSEEFMKKRRESVGPDYYVGVLKSIRW